MSIFYIEANSMNHRKLVANGWVTLSVLEIGVVMLAKIAKI